MAHTSYNVATATPRPLPPLAPVRFIVPEDSYWLLAAEQASEAGKAWVNEFGTHFGIVDRLQATLTVMRRGRLQEAYSTVQECLSEIRAIRGASRTVLAVLYQEYHRVAGYYHHKVNNFSLAVSSMQLSIAGVEEALSECDFLLALAAECVDFHVNQARVARNQRRWAEMLRIMDHGKAMMANQAPLCAGPGGKPVFFSDLRDFMLSLKLPRGGDGRCVRLILSLDERMRAIDLFNRGICKFPGFAIEY